MLFWPPPPSRVVVPTTPGVRDVSDAKLRAENRQVLDFGGRDAERALAALRLDQRRFRLDRDGLGRPADRQRQRADADAVAAADRDAGADDRREPGHRDLDGVGVRGDVRDDEVAGGIGDDRRHSACRGLR